MPRLDVAARAAAAPPRPRGALRLRLPDPARRPTSRRSTARPAPTQDFTDLHAWCEVYLPGAGWIGLDPTSGLLAGEGHIPLVLHAGAGRARRRSPARVDECEVEFEHAMSVQRVHESPRVTKPYTDAQWAAIVAIGHARRRRARARHDVRLTMGGEPTFVSVDDRDGAEWNTTALGPTKRLLAADLLWRLRQHYGADGFVHFGQGKWYPGEQLPRWALGCYWRRDGEPAWRDPSLFADERSRLRLSAPPDAERFLRALAPRARRRPTRTCRPATRTSGTTCGASAGCRSTSIRSTRASTTSSSASGCAASSRRASMRVVGYALPLAPIGRRAALAHRAVVPARRADVSVPGRLADGLSPAARLAAVGREDDRAT